MYIAITNLSDYGHTILKENKNAKVHSVYQKTINLQFGDTLLAIQARQSVLSPLSLITNLEDSEISYLAIQPGMTVSVTGSSITFCQIPSLKFSFSNALVTDLTLSETSNVEIHLKERIGTAINLSEGSGFSSLFQSTNKYINFQDPIIRYASHQMDTCRSFCLTGTYQNAAEALGKLIGLGIGLTPSGDDFLCGVLAGLRIHDCDVTCFSRALCREIRSKLGNTNDISRAFLDCALKGWFSLPVIRLKDPLSPEEILSDFRRIGHSSGLDTLSGILYALSYIVDSM